MHTNTSSVNIGSIDGVVIGLTLATAAIHAYLVPAEFEKGATGYGTLFILTAAGYLGALSIRYLPAASLAPMKIPALLLILGIAVAAIIAYLSLGYFDTLGWVTKAIEAVLAAAVVAAVKNTQT
jgi:hypothetical protein